MAALGAGLVDLALASQNRGTAPALLGFALVGGYLLLWGVGALGLPRLPLPRTTGAVLVLAIGTTGILAVSGSPLVGSPGEGPGLAPLGATALQLGALAGMLIAQRRAAPGRRRTSQGPLRQLAWLAVSALVTAALATPAMADTTAGEHARPHGSHLFPGLHEHH